MSRIVVVVPGDAGAEALVVAGVAERAIDLDGAIDVVRAGEDVLVILPGQVPGVGCSHVAAVQLLRSCEAAGLTRPTVVTGALEVLATAEPVDADDAPASPAAPAAPAAPAVGPDSGDDGPHSGVDWKVLRALEDDLGDPEFVGETIEVFLAELPGRTFAIVDGVRRGVATDFVAAAHSLKSSSAMLGALLLASLCLQLESAGTAGDLTPTPRLAQALSVEADIVAVQLRDRTG